MDGRKEELDGVTETRSRRMGKVTNMVERTVNVCAVKPHDLVLISLTLDVPERSVKRKACNPLDSPSSSLLFFYVPVWQPATREHIFYDVHMYHLARRDHCLSGSNDRNVRLINRLPVLNTFAMSAW